MLNEIKFLVLMGDEARWCWKWRLKPRISEFCGKGDKASGLGRPKAEGQVLPFFGVLSFPICAFRRGDGGPRAPATVTAHCSTSAPSLDWPPPSFCSSRAPGVSLGHQACPPLKTNSHSLGLDSSLVARPSGQTGRDAGSGTT